MIEITSDVFEVAAPEWLGAWVHDPANPEGTAKAFPYGNSGRKEKLGVDATLVRMVGRALPIAEYGTNEEQSFTLAFMVPFDADHDAAVQWWRDRVRARATLCYRDGRKRLAYVSISEASIEDGRAGTTIAATATAVDFSEAV